MSAPPEIKSRLAMLREVFAHGPKHQDWIGDWWASMSVSDRRLLLALAGLDDSEESARRPWRNILQDTRDTLLTECKRVARLTERLKWA
jgi:hypothetical protein